MQLSKIQSQVVKNKKRFTVISAGRRSGKTTLAIREMCYQARLPKQNIWYLTSSYRAAKMIAFKQLKETLLDLNWVEKINESELMVTLKNGSQISLKGSDNGGQALRGVKLTYCVIDEAGYVDGTVFYEVIRPALADSQGGCLIISTPAGKSNWFFDVFQKEKEDPVNWKSFQFTTQQGGFVPQEEIQQAKSELSQSQFNQEFNATFENLGSQIAYAWDRDTHIKEKENVNHKELHIGMDFNISPSTATVMVRDKDDLYVIDEVVMYSSNTNEMADEIKNRYPHSKIICYPDPAGAAGSTKSRGQTDHTILHNAGFKILAPRRHDAVRDRINALNARLSSADGKNHLFVSKRCKYTIESLEKYCYKPGTQIPDKDSGFDHIFDALSYCVSFLFPLKRTQAPYVPQRWGITTKEKPFWR